MNGNHDRRGSKEVRAWRVVLPGYASTRIPATNIAGINRGGPTAPNEQSELGKLVMDFTAIGIPTTSTTFAVRVEGDSMVNAGIHDGDVVLLDKRGHRSGDIVSALVENQVTLKRYVIEKGRHLLRPENPQYTDLVLDEHAEVQGVVIGLIRKF
jgi:repressor LexA